MAIKLDKEAQDSLDGVRTNFCDVCMFFETCPFRQDDKFLAQHIFVEENGAYACNEFASIMFTFLEESMSVEQKAILKKYNIQFGKEYSLLEVKSVVALLANSTPDMQKVK